MNFRCSYIAIFLSALAASPFAFSNAVESPRDQRYLNDVFKETLQTRNIIYAKHFNNTSNREESLTFRLFEPKDDKVTKRPLFILTPGGGFVQHGETWMDTFAEQMARAGYVVAVNRYRLSDAINSPEKFSDALFKAFADQKALIRFFMKDAQTKNTYRIDPDNIFIGGHSGGAITSMQVAYLDEKDELPDPLKQALANNGGLDGVKGKEKLKYKIRGVVNLSGLVTDLNVFDAGEPALLSIHGDLDNVVLIGSGDFGVQGSIPIHKRAQDVGLTSELHVIRGGLHNDTAEPDLCAECVPLTKRFMFETMKQGKRVATEGKNNTSSDQKATQ